VLFFHEGHELKNRKAGKPMYRGNVDKVKTDAEKIAKRLRETDVTLKELIKEYRTGYQATIEAILSQMSETEWHKIRKKRLARGGKNTRFKKGHKAWNKGIPFNAGGRSVETRFKKGHIRGAAAQNYKTVGMITIRHDKPPKRLRRRKRKAGMPPWRGKERRWIKVKDNGPYSRRWIPYARYLWEKEHGPVPKGFFVVHKDGDQMNDCAENLTLVDNKRHVAMQMKRDPGHEKRFRAAGGKAARLRHEANRQKKKLSADGA
jgi:hypothetical protein